jgi:hypothetical protein
MEMIGKSPKMLFKREYLAVTLFAFAKGAPSAVRRLISCFAPSHICTLREQKA